MTSIAEWRGLWRSLRVYRMDKAHAHALDQLYAKYLRPGDLAFDIGAHVGDRIASFRRLGARVVALEPQKACARVLRLLHGRDQGVAIVEAGAAETPGRVTFSINSKNPTVSTLSRDFVAAANSGAQGWEGQVWDRSETIEVTTLDALIAQYGEPRFIKIDVEGAEEHVLKGLSRPVAALSFEFTTIQRAIAFACIDRCARLGYAQFNLSLGESQHMTFAAPVDAATMRDHVAGLPHEANSGDIYVTRDSRNKLS